MSPGRGGRIGPSSSELDDLPSLSSFLASLKTLAYPEPSLSDFPECLRLEGGGGRGGASPSLSVELETCFLRLPLLLLLDLEEAPGMEKVRGSKDAVIHTLGFEEYWACIFANSRSISCILRVLLSSLGGLLGLTGTPFCLGVRKKL